MPKHFHIKVVELYQTVEEDIEVESYEELSDEISFIRSAIKAACSDVAEKKITKASNVNKPLPKKQDLATEKQISLIKRRASPEQLDNIDFNTLTMEQASAILDQIL